MVIHIPSGKLTSLWKMTLEIVDLAIENGDHDGDFISNDGHSDGHRPIMYDGDIVINI